MEVLNFCSIYVFTDISAPCTLWWDVFIDNIRYYYKLIVCLNLIPSNELPLMITELTCHLSKLDDVIDINAPYTNWWGAFHRQHVDTTINYKFVTTWMPSYRYDHRLDLSSVQASSGHHPPGPQTDQLLGSPEDTAWSARYACPWKRRNRG